MHNKEIYYISIKPKKMKMSSMHNHLVTYVKPQSQLAVQCKCFVIVGVLRVLPVVPPVADRSG